MVCMCISWKRDFPVIKGFIEHGEIHKGKDAGKK